MNEEELENEIIDKLLSERFDKPVKNGTMPCVIFSRQEFIEGMKYCFQKGKLEQKKEDKNKQDEFYNEFDLASNCSKDDKLFKKLWNKYFKQLQKEIGGKRE